MNVLLLPDEGAVWIDGKDTSMVEELNKIRDQVGMVFQNPDNQIIGTTVEEDVAFGLENRGAESSLIRKRVDESLCSVGMISKRKALPYNLSGGQKQRVAIAGVLSCLPGCIVFDEPTAMLDPHSRKEVISIIKKINREEKTTVVLITHHMDEAVDADRIILMSGGDIAAEGTPREIFSDMNLLKKYKMDIPQVTELANRLRKSGVPFSNPVLSEEQFMEEFHKIYAAADRRHNNVIES